MQQWEYKVVNSGPSGQGDLNDFGREGWELVAVVQAETIHHHRLVFKRAVPSCFARLMALGATLRW